jgi:hypothetical protein
MASVDIDSLCFFSHPERLVEMKSDVEATAHSPEHLVSKNERLITMRMRKRSESSGYCVKQVFLDHQAGMSPPIPINLSIALETFMLK